MILFIVAFFIIILFIVTFVVDYYLSFGGHHRLSVWDSFQNIPDSNSDLACNLKNENQTYTQKNGKQVENVIWDFLYKLTSL